MVYCGEEAVKPEGSRHDFYEPKSGAFSPNASFRLKAPLKRSNSILVRGKSFLHERPSRFCENDTHTHNIVSRGHFAEKQNKCIPRTCDLCQREKSSPSALGMKRWKNAAESYSLLMHTINFKGCIFCSTLVAKTKRSTGQVIHISMK